MKISRTYYGVLAIFCVFVICFGIASAAGITQSPGQLTREKGQMHPGFDLKNTSAQQEMLSRLAQQGTDVTGLKAAFASGNMADVKTWMDNNRPVQPGRPEGAGHPGFDLTNVTCQQEMLSRFAQQGTDVTGLKAAFASGNMADVKTWMDNNRPVQSGRPEGAGHSGFDLTNVTKQQEMISRLAQQGTDVTGLKAAFASGNMTDVKTWLDANRPTHPGGQPNHRQQDTTSSS